MAMDSWDRLVALLPPPSNSVVGRSFEAVTGTVHHVKSLLTQEEAAGHQHASSCAALSRSMTQAHQKKIAAKFSKPKMNVKAVDMERLHPKRLARKCSQTQWGVGSPTAASSLPPLPGAKKEFSVESQYKLVNGRMASEPEEDLFVRQERSQITAWRLATFYTWGGRLRHRQPTQRPLSEFYDAHMPGKILPLRL